MNTPPFHACRRGVLIVTALLILGSVHSARAGLIVFNELPNQVANGLTFNGVRFGFTIGGVVSTDARFGASGPGNQTHVQDPSLEGNARGVLSLDFIQPVSALSFGVGISSMAALSPGFTVQLFDPSLALLGTFPINAPPAPTFSGASFLYMGAPVRRASLSFNSTPANPGGRFAFDNLDFSSIPEPGTIGFGLALLGACLARRKY